MRLYEIVYGIVFEEVSVLAQFIGPTWPLTLPITKNKHLSKSQAYGPRWYTRQIMKYIVFKTENNLFFMNIPFKQWTLKSLPMVHMADFIRFIPISHVYLHGRFSKLISPSSSLLEFANELRVVPNSEVHLQVLHDNLDDLLELRMQRAGLGSKYLSTWSEERVK